MKIRIIISLNLLRKSQIPILLCQIWILNLISQQYLYLYSYSYSKEENKHKYSNSHIRSVFGPFISPILTTLLHLAHSYR